MQYHDVDDSRTGWRRNVDRGRIHHTEYSARRTRRGRQLCHNRRRTYALANRLTARGERDTWWRIIIR